MLCEAVMDNPPQRLPVLDDIVYALAGPEIRRRLLYKRKPHPAFERTRCGFTRAIGPPCPSTWSPTGTEDISALLRPASTFPSLPGQTAGTASSSQCLQAVVLGRGYMVVGRSPEDITVNAVVADGGKRALGRAVSKSSRCAYVLQSPLWKTFQASQAPCSAGIRGEVIGITIDGECAPVVHYAAAVIDSSQPAWGATGGWFFALMSSAGTP